MSLCCRLLFIIFLIVCPAHVIHGQSDRPTRTSFLLGWSPRVASFSTPQITDWTITGRPIILTTIEDRSSSLYAKITVDTVAGLTNRVTLFQGAYLEGFVYSGSQKQSGYVTVAGLGLLQGVQYGPVYMEVGIGGYQIKPQNGVSRINDRSGYEGFVSAGGKAMVGTQLGRYLFLEAGTTYLFDRTITPGPVAGIGVRW